MSGSGLSHFRKYEKALKEAGWTFSGVTGKGHRRWNAPPGSSAPRKFITLPSTPGAGRSTANFRAQLKRYCDIDLTD